MINTSPLAGLDGNKLTASLVESRLRQELVGNVSLRVLPTESPDGCEVQGRGELIKVRDHLMPLIRLHQIFGVEPKHLHPWEALVLVVGESGSRYCLLVDEILGRQEVVIKSFGGSMRNLVGVSGGAIFGDGKVALIIDVKGVVNLFEGSKK